MFVSNVCRIIVETVSAVSYHFAFGTNDWTEQFWRVMWDLLQKDSHEDSHRWSCHITHVRPCHCRLPIECWVFLTVEYRTHDVSSVTWGWLRTPLCSFDLIFVSGVSDFAACPSVKFWQSYCLSHRQLDSAELSVAPSCGHLWPFEFENVESAELTLMGSSVAIT